MPKKNLVVVCLAIILTAGSSMAIFAANPTKVVPYEKFRISAEFNYEKWLMRYDIGPNYNLDSRRMLLKPSLGIFHFVEAYGILGFADLDLPSVSTAYTDFNGSQELCFGLGLKTHYALYYPAIGCRRISKDPIRLYSEVSWLTTKSSDEVIFGGGVLHYVDSYRFQQADIGFYGSWQFGRTIPYLGLKWTYITGHKYRKAYSGTSGIPFTKMDGLFTYPQQYPKPVVGLDITLGKGYVLSLEANYWGKSETSIGIGLSQQYVPEGSYEEDNQAIEGPDFH